MFILLIPHLVCTAHQPSEADLEAGIESARAVFFANFKVQAEDINFLKMKSAEVLNKQRELLSHWKWIKENCQTRTDLLKTCGEHIETLYQNTIFFEASIEALRNNERFQALANRSTGMAVDPIDVFHQVDLGMNDFSHALLLMRRKMSASLAAAEFQELMNQVHADQAKIRQATLCKLAPSRLKIELANLRLTLISADDSSDGYLVLRAIAMAMNAQSELDLLQKNCAFTDDGLKSSLDAILARDNPSAINAMGQRACKNPKLSVEVKLACHGANQISPTVLFAIHRELIKGAGK